MAVGNAAREIRRAGRRQEKLDILYLKKTGGTDGEPGDLVWRTISPYEIQHGRYVYATDDDHGADQIHSFLLSNIYLINRTREEFEPWWRIRL